MRDFDALTIVFFLAGCVVGVVLLKVIGVI